MRRLCSGIAMTWRHSPQRTSQVDDAEKLAVQMSSFQCPMIVGVGLGKTRGLNSNFDEDAARLYRLFALSAAPHVNGDSMYVKAAGSDPWHADNTRSDRIAYAGYVAMVIRVAIGFGNLLSL